MGAVEQQIDATQVKRFEARLKRAQVVLLSSVEFADAADFQRRARGVC